MAKDLKRNRYYTFLNPEKSDDISGIPREERRRRNLNIHSAYWNQVQQGA